MAETVQLKYDIVEKGKLFGEGDINNIKERTLNQNRTFKLISQEDQSFQLALRFKLPSIVKKVNLKLIEVYRYQIKLMKQNKKLVWSNEQTIKGKHDTVELRPDNFQDVQLAQLIIFNSPSLKKRMGIVYIIFEGICDELPDKNSSKKSKIVKKEEGQYSSHQKKVKIQQNLKSTQTKEMFKLREREKTPKQKLTDFSQFDMQFQGKKLNDKLKRQHQESKTQRKQESKYGVENRSSIKKKLKYNEDEVEVNEREIRKKIEEQKRKQQQDTQLAIALSLSEEKNHDLNNEFEKMEVENEEQHKADSIPEQLKNYQFEQNFVPFQDRTYEFVQLNDQYLQNFSDLNPKWLQAQRQAQKQSNVRQQEKLSNYVKLKYLNGTEVFIDGFSEWKQHQIQFYAKQLGCIILKELKNHCIAVVTRQTGQHLRKKHKAWSDVKYISSEYISDCAKNQSKLRPSDYYLKL